MRTPVLCAGSALMILILLTTPTHARRLIPIQVFCKPPSSDTCFTWFLPTSDEYRTYSPYLKTICGLLRDETFYSEIAEEGNVPVVSLRSEPTPFEMYCPSISSTTKDILERDFVKRARRQTNNPRGKYRGQTQSQYMSIGSGNDDGKAEAHSAADSSRASVRGKSGMGQAQSQTIFDPSCDGCLNNHYAGAENLKRPAQRGFAPGGTWNGPKADDGSQVNMPKQNSPGSRPVTGGNYGLTPGNTGGLPGVPTYGSTPGGIGTPNSGVYGQHGNYGPGGSQSPNGMPGTYGQSPGRQNGAGIPGSNTYGSNGGQDNGGRAGIGGTVPNLYSQTPGGPNGNIGHGGTFPNAYGQTAGTPNGGNSGQGVNGGIPTNTYGQNSGALNGNVGQGPTSTMPNTYGQTPGRPNNGNGQVPTGTLPNTYGQTPGGQNGNFGQGPTSAIPNTWQPGRGPNNGNIGQGSVPNSYGQIPGGPNSNSNIGQGSVPNSYGQIPGGPNSNGNIGQGSVPNTYGQIPSGPNNNGGQGRLGAIPNTYGQTPSGTNGGNAGQGPIGGNPNAYRPNSGQEPYGSPGTWPGNYGPGGNGNSPGIYNQGPGGQGIGGNYPQTTGGSSGPLGAPGSLYLPPSGSFTGPNGETYVCCVVNSQQYQPGSKLGGLAGPVGGGSIPGSGIQGGQYNPQQVGTYGSGTPQQPGTYGTPGIGSKQLPNSGSIGGGQPYPGQYDAGISQHPVNYGSGTLTGNGSPQSGTYGSGTQQSGTIGTGAPHLGQNYGTGTLQQPGTYSPGSPLNGQQGSGTSQLGRTETGVPQPSGPFVPAITQPGTYGSATNYGNGAPQQSGMYGPGTIQTGSYGPGTAPPTYGSTPSQAGSYGTGTQQPGGYGPGVPQTGVNGLGSPQPGSYLPGTGASQTGGYGPGTSQTGTQANGGSNNYGSGSPVGNVPTSQYGTSPNTQGGSGPGNQQGYGLPTTGNQGTAGTRQPNGDYGTGGTYGSVPNSGTSPFNNGNPQVPGNYPQSNYNTQTGPYAGQVPGGPNAGNIGQGATGGGSLGAQPGNQGYGNQYGQNSNTNSNPWSQNNAGGGNTGSGSSNGAGGTYIPSEVYGGNNQNGPGQNVDGNNGPPQNVIDPNSVYSVIDDDSEALASVSQDSNGTIASASSKGGNEKGRAQTQVQGTYTGSGSFSAQAQISDENKGADSQVSGGKQGASSNAQGHGRNNKSQANVQLGSETGALQTQAQSDGASHSSNSQVQGSLKGGMADAQAKGPGSTQSQAQIGFTPYNKNDNIHDTMKTPFVGSGTASSQSSGRIGQSQSQLQGTFKYGITYSGAAQAGSSVDKDAVFPNRLPFSKIDVFDESNKNIDVEADLPTSTVLPEEIDSLNKGSKIENDKPDTTFNDHEHAAHHISDSQTTDTPSAVGTRRSFQAPAHNNAADYEYSDKDIPEDYDADNIEPEPVEGDYSNMGEFDREDTQPQSIQTSNRKQLNFKTKPGNTQHILLGSVRNQDTPRPEYDRVYMPGETVPGTRYTIPAGFTGSVKTVGDKTYESSARDSAPRASTYHSYPRTLTTSSNNQYVKSKDLKSLYNTKQDDNNRYMSVSKSVTGALDGDNNIKKQYSHTYYTKSSSCGYFTFTCTMVSGPNGRKKVCRPKIPTNPDGTPMKC